MQKHFLRIYGQEISFDGREHSSRRLSSPVSGSSDRSDGSRGESGDAIATLFHSARQITDSIATITLGRANALGRVPTCEKGCGACCTQLVPISRVEAVHLARVVRAFDPARARLVRKCFDDAIRRLERAGLLDRGAPRGRSSMTARESDGESLWDTLSRRYRELAIACPFLEKGSCSIYEDRPLVCREYFVTSDKNECAKLRGDVNTLPRPVRMSEALADAADVLTGESVPSIPLVLSLEWAEHHDVHCAPTDADSLVDTLFACIEVEDERF